MPTDKSSKPIRSPTAGFYLDGMLIPFNDQFDGLSFNDMLGGGVLVTGDAGVGKTTGILAPVALALLRTGASIVFTTVKPADGRYWTALAGLAGRPVRLVRVGEDRFNPIAHEQRRSDDGGGQVENIVSLLTLPMKRQRRDGSGGDPFWAGDAARAVRHLTTIYVLAGKPISYRLICDSLLNLPRSVREIRDPAWRARCPAYAALLAAEPLAVSVVDRADLDAAAEFLLRTAPTMPSRTRASTVATYCSATDPYIHGLIGQTINSDTDTWSPREVVDKPGQVVVFDAPMQRWGEIGSTVQRMFLTSLQREILRRSVTASTHAIVIFADEFQEFLDPEDDPAFMRTARDRRSCMVIATQCVSNIRAACGGAQDSRSAAEAILGLPSVKIFCATADPETLDYIGRVFTHTLQTRVSISTGEGGGSREGRRKRGDDGNTTISRDLMPDVPAHEIAGLARAPANGPYVEAFVSVSGRRWKSTGRPSIKVAFPQVRFSGGR